MKKQKRDRLPVAKYQLICDALEGEIRALRHPPGHKFITAVEAQRRFSVSSITATHALNQLRDRGLVERRRRHGTFVTERPFQMKANNAASNAHVVGLIWEALPATSRGIEMLQVIEKELAEAGYGVMFKASDEEPYQERKCLEWFHAHGIHRVLMTPSGSREDWAMYEEFRVRGMRIVFMDRGVDSPHFPLVAFDDRQIGRLAVCELKQAGYRKIAVVTTARQDTSVDARVEGAVKVCSGQCLDAQIFSVSMGDYLAFIRNPDAMKPWWRRARVQAGAPCGWFSVNEQLASALLEVMLQTGVKIPADHGLIGVGNLLLTPAAALFLTSIELPFAEFGRAAARCVMADEPTNVRLAPSGVVRRASTTPGMEIHWDRDVGRQKFQPAGRLVEAVVGVEE
ncbi:MAG: substrate-binding domain-containing protein [Verrucomicrobia bacterium]|nr:substrate-binding domain-containing protein [Verrucomicrobiota bacterium]